MFCHNCNSDDINLGVMDSPIIIDQVEVFAICRVCETKHGYSISGGDFDMIEPESGQSPASAGHPPIGAVLMTVMIWFLIFSLPSFVSAHPKTYCETCERDGKGHIKRDRKQVNEFKKQTPCPSTGKPTGACPGYVVDHIKPLACGGMDTPLNMQWQTKKDAKEKDKTERDCK